MEDWLIQAYAYDLSANERWIETLKEWKDPEADAVMRHLLQAQRSWLSRVDPELPPTATDDLRADAEALHHAIVRAIKEYDLEHHIVYENMKGDRFTQPLWEILSHVVNHGTYHRGHLRGLARDREFPDTDLITYFRRLHD